MGLVTKQMLRKFRRVVYVALSIVAAIFSPPDVISMLSVWIPLCILYEVGVLAVALVVHPYLYRVHMKDHLDEKIKLVLVELVMPLLLSWFLMTILVDIIVIPTFLEISPVFRKQENWNDRFGKFNWMEVMMASLVLIGVVNRPLRQPWLIGLSAFLLCHVLNYALYMTPTITATTMQIHQTNVTDPMFAALQAKHAFYHTFYRYLDTTKLLLLLSFIVINLMTAVKEKLGEIK